jgi:hypothetical protein
MTDNNFLATIPKGDLQAARDAFDYRDTAARIVNAKPDIVKIQSQTRNFEFPGGELLKTFDGTIYFDAVTRTYWEKSFEAGGGARPDCFSADSIRPSSSIVPPIAETCAACKFSQWGSSPKGGKGQACRQTRHLFVLMPNADSPIDLHLPPTSIDPVDEYFQQLVRAKFAFPAMVTRFSLEKVNKGGNDYAKIVLEPVGFTPAGKIGYIKKLIAGAPAMLARIVGGTVDEATPKEDAPF